MCEMSNMKEKDERGMSAIKGIYCGCACYEIGLRLVAWVFRNVDGLVREMASLGDDLTYSIELRDKKQNASTRPYDVGRLVYTVYIVPSIPLDVLVQSGVTCTVPCSAGEAHIT